MKTYCIIIFLSLACHFLFAQNKFISVHAGPKVCAIVVMPQYDLWFTDKFGKGLSWGAGAFVELGLGERFALQVEGLSEQFNFVWKYDEFKIFEKFSYISVPVIAKFKLQGFGLYAGYQWAHLNFAERKMEQYGPSDPYGLDKIYEYDWHSANRMYAKTSNAVLFGVEYTSRLGLGFSVRYVKGLTDLTVPDIRNSIFVTNDEIYNSYVSVGVYWSFGKNAPKASLSRND
jgi:hypothetical protein